MPNQNFLGKKSEVKSGLPLVAMAIVVIGAFIILGLIVLARPATDDNSDIETENQKLNQNTNNQILFPIKNSPQVKPQSINLNLSLTNQTDEAEDELTFTFDQTYPNSEYNFSVSYPKEYTYQESKPDQALLTVTFLSFAENIPTITVYNDRSLASEIENALLAGVNSSIEIEKKTYTNIEATQITTASTEAANIGVKRVIWEKDNHLFELTGVKSDSFLTEMLNSFVFL